MGSVKRDVVEEGEEEEGAPLKGGLFDEQLGYDQFGHPWLMQNFKPMEISDKSLVILSDDSADQADHE